MEIVIIVIVALAGFSFFAMKRGQKTVRAFVFLSELSSGKTEFEANQTSSRIDLFAASKMQDQAINFVNITFGGSQLTLVSEARLLGFKG